MLRKTSHSAFEGDRRGDRPEQYRPCPLPARAPGLGLAGPAARDDDDVPEHPDERRGRRDLRRPVRHAQPHVRSGYRPREFDTRTGTLELAIPKLRTGSYFPDWLLERRRRAEAALTTVVATCYLLGVSTRRMEKLVETLGITRLSKSQVSVMAKDLDAHVADFRSRPLDAGPYTFVAAMRWCSRSARAAGSSTSMRCSRPA
jgi:hypothetical protein